MVIAVFYDLDGTIVGNVTPQVVEWHIVKQYQPSRMAAFKAQLIDVLRHHLVRPGFTDFHNGLLAALPHVEFFVYTASDHAWASTLVPCLEKALDVRFNRPLFTRRHVVQEDACGDTRKSLDRVATLAHRSLLKKGYQVSVADIIRNAVLIDNNRVLVTPETSRLILCPTYDYILYQDVLRHIPISVLRENMHAIREDLADAGIMPLSRQDVPEETFLTSYYSGLGVALASAAHVDRDSRRDVFWKALLGPLVKRIKKDGALTDSGIASINAKIKITLEKHAAAHKRAKRSKG